MTSSPEGRQEAAVALTYGQKLIAEAIQEHFGERVDDYDEDVDDTSNHDAWEAFDRMVSALSAPVAAAPVGVNAREAFLDLMADAVEWHAKADGEGTYHTIVTQDHQLRTLAKSVGIETRYQEMTEDAIARAIYAGPAKPAVDLVEAQLIRWAHDTLYEINPDNYDHAEVCKLNDASVEVILGLAQYLGERHGKTEEWWRDYRAKHPLAALQAPATPDAQTEVEK